MKILDEAEKNFRLMMKHVDYPDCFRDKNQYKVWSELEEIAHTKPRKLPCRDCTPEYQRRMVDEGRCANAKVIDISRIMQRKSQQNDEDS